jgi:2-hydroxy-6-oxonona-2,4-dienedioate hydrolase
MRPNAQTSLPTWVDEGNGPVVILIHGLFAHHDFWKSTTEMLRVRYRVITLQLPYFDLQFESLSLKNLAKVLHDFIFWRHLSDVTVVAHGIGGQVAVLCDHIYPGSLSRIVLSGTPVRRKTDPEPEPTLVALVDKQYITRRVAQAFKDRARMPQTLVDVTYHTLQNIPRRLAAGSILRSAHRLHLQPLLQHVTTPMLLLWGHDDSITTPEEALAFYDHLPVAEIRFIKDCGHLPMVEKPEEFNIAMANFLSTPMRQAVGY